MSMIDEPCPKCKRPNGKAGGTGHCKRCYPVAGGYGIVRQHEVRHPEQIVGGQGGEIRKYPARTEVISKIEWCGSRFELGQRLSRIKNLEGIIIIKVAEVGIPSIGVKIEGIQG